MKNILKEHGLDLGPKRGEGTWDEFLKMHLETLWACDFLTKEVWTLHGKVTYYILFFIEVATRRVHVAGMTPNPTGELTAQMTRNVRMWWEEHGIKPSHIIKDRDTRFTSQFDAMLESIGATMKTLPRKSPNLNAYTEAWVGTFRRECLDKFIAFGESHLDQIGGVYERYYNSVRVHSSLGNEPIWACEPPPDAVSETKDGIVCKSWLGGVLRHCRRAAA